MNALKLSLHLLKKDKKNSLFYLGSSIITFTILFGIFNILYDENITELIAPEFIIFTSVLSALVLFIVVAIGYYSNEFFMEKRKKEIAIQLVSGLSINELAVSTGAINTIISILSLVASFILGVILSPVINNFLYFLIGLEGVTFKITFDGFISAFSMIFINIMLLGLLNVGLGYRTEICDLVRSKSGTYKRKKTSKSKVIFGRISLIICLACLVYSVVSTSNDAIAIFAPLGIILFIVVCKTLIPHTLRKLSSKNKDSINSIVLNNVLVDLEKATISLIASGTIVSFFCYSLVYYKIDIGFTISCTGVLLLLLLLFLIGTLYTINSIAYSRIRNFKILDTLGYTKNNINKIIVREVLIFLIILLVIPAIYLITGIVRFSFLQIIPLNFANILLIILGITFITLSVLSYFIYFKVINNNLYGGKKDE